MFAGLPTSGLVVLLGAPGSGKSTFVSLAFGPGDVVSLDELRIRIGGSVDALHATPAAVEVLCTVVGHRLRDGLFTVVDSTGTAEHLAERLVELAGECGSPVQFVLVSPPLETSLAHNRRRSAGQVPESAVRAIAADVERVAGEVATQGIRVRRMESYLRHHLVGRSAFLAMPVTENLGGAGFRADKTTFYQRVHAALEMCGLVVRSAAVNEDYGSVMLEPAVYTKYDIDGILASDCLLVGTTTSLSPDIYLEVGTAVGAGIPVGLAIPVRGRMTGMLRGLVRTGYVTERPIELDDQLATSLCALAMDLVGDPRG